MRLQNSARNIRAAWACQLIHIVCQIFSRTAIIKILTIEYVGLSGLFSNILTMLSLAELGIGEAIIFSMYSPIAKGEKENILSIMSFYKKVYMMVGLFVFIVGIALTPWIGNFIKEMPDIPDIKLIYALYVANTSVSYFFAYKAAFVTANQNNYIVSINNCIWQIAMVAVQIGILLTTKNYIAYMIVGIVFVFLQNVSISVIANRKYPTLKEKTNRPIPIDIFNQIKKNTGAMVFHKIGTIIVFATDNLIISKYIGIVTVGIYANYCTITNGITVFINKFFNGISASVGNLAVDQPIEKQESTMFKVLFANFWLYSFSCCCLMNLLNPFISDIWLGEKYIFDKWIVLLIVAKIYLNGMRSTTQTFKNAKGLYWQNRYMPVFESIINLVVSLILVKKIGVAGVLLGTIISSVATCLWIEPYVLYKHGFGKSAEKYYKKYLEYLVIFAAVMLITYACNELIEGNSVAIFVVRCLLCGVLPNILLIMIFLKTEEFRFFIELLIKKKKRKHDEI